MAERRMFAKSIIDSDAFLDMPVTARLLYYDLSMRADDDGFINSPKKIMRIVGASIDDMNILISKKFIIPFDNGVVVIKHWRIHNYIRKDTYNETNYKEQKEQLELDENDAYRLSTDNARQRAVDEPSTSRGRAVDEPSTQVRLGKVRLGKDSIGKSNRFTPPTKADIETYLDESGYIMSEQDIDRFLNYYTSNGWKVGRNPMKDWKATVRNWSTGKKKKEKEKTNVADKKLLLERLKDE